MDTKEIRLALCIEGLLGILKTLVPVFSDLSAIICIFYIVRKVKPECRTLYSFLVI